MLPYLSRSHPIMSPGKKVSKETKWGIAIRCRGAKSRLTAVIETAAENLFLSIGCIKPLKKVSSATAAMRPENDNFSTAPKDLLLGRSSQGHSNATAVRKRSVTALITRVCPRALLSHAKMRDASPHSVLCSFL